MVMATETEEGAAGRFKDSYIYIDNSFKVVVHNAAKCLCLSRTLLLPPVVSFSHTQLRST